MNCAGREGEIARDILAELNSRLDVSKRGRARVSFPRPGCADVERRRGATDPIGGATRFESARRVLHPRRTDHWPASARQSDVAPTRCINWRRRATRLSWSNTTRTQFVTPNTLWILVPVPVVNGGRLVAEGTIKDIVRSKESLTGQSAARTVAPSAAHAPYRQNGVCRGRRADVAQFKKSAREVSAGPVGVRDRRETAVARARWCGMFCIAA